MVKYYNQPKSIRSVGNVCYGGSSSNTLSVDLTVANFSLGTDISLLLYANFCDNRFCYLQGNSKESSSTNAATLSIGYHFPASTASSPSSNDTSEENNGEKYLVLGICVLVVGVYISIGFRNKSTPSQSNTALKPRTPSHGIHPSHIVQTPSNVTNNHNGQGFIYCPNCSIRLGSDFRFCFNCRFEIDKVKPDPIQSKKSN